MRTVTADLLALSSGGVRLQMQCCQAAGQHRAPLPRRWRIGRPMTLQAFTTRWSVQASVPALRCRRPLHRQATWSTPFHLRHSMRAAALLVWRASSPCRWQSRAPSHLAGHRSVVSLQRMASPSRYAHCPGEHSVLFLSDFLRQILRVCLPTHLPAGQLAHCSKLALPTHLLLNQPFQG